MRPNGEQVGILNPLLGKTNTHHTPYWSVIVYLAISVLVVIAAGGRDQELVLFYAVAVFVSFLSGLLAMARFSLRDRDHGLVVINLFGALVVVFTIGVNLGRGYPVASLVVAAGIAGVFYRLWARAGRPRGIAQVERDDGDRRLSRLEHECHAASLYQTS